MKRLAAVFAAACAVAGLTFAAGAPGALRAPGKPAAAAPIVVGGAVALTGFVYQVVDQPVIFGAQIAVAELNARGGAAGRPLKMIYADTKSDISLGATAAEQVVSKGAHVVLTSCDYDFGSPAARAANSHGLLALGCAGGALFGFRGVGPLTFNTNSGTATEGAVAAQFAYELGWRKIYVLTDTTLAYPRERCSFFEIAFKRLAGKNAIVGKDTFLQSDPSIATQVNRLRAASVKPDALYLCSYQPGAASALRQIRAGGLGLPVLGGAEFDGAFWTAAVPNVSNLYHTALGSIAGDDPRPAVNRFFDRWRKRYKSEPAGSFGLLGYATIETLLRAVEKTKGSTSGKALENALESFKNEPLILGPTTYTKTCHVPVHRPYVVMHWNAGKDSFAKLINPTYVPKALC
jgi:branched-chain amino acid transport system substrate-binding protein